MEETQVQEVKRPDYFQNANNYLASLAGTHEVVNNIHGVISRLQRKQLSYEEAHEAIKSMLDPIVTEGPDSAMGKLKRTLKVLIFRPIQKMVGTAPAQEGPPPDKGYLIAFVNSLRDKEKKNAFGRQLMREGLTKGAPASQINPHSQRIRQAMSRIIAKLAALNQPLRNRPDYGTTADIAERLKKFQDDELDAAMYKEITLPNPKPVAIDYDDPGAGCCPKCRGSHREPVLAHCMDGRFKRIRSMLKGRGEVTLSGAETKTILDALDDIHKKYRELEDR